MPPPLSSAAQQRVPGAAEWGATQVASGFRGERFVVHSFQEQEHEKSVIGATLLGSAVGAGIALAYFSVRDEDSYECNACGELALDGLRAWSDMLSDRASPLD